MEGRALYPAQPSIELLGLEIREPVTSLTDLIVAGVCFYAAYRLRKTKSSERAVVYFRYFFLTMGISTTLGGLIGHAFLYAFGFTWKIPGWITGMCSVAFMERAAIMQARSAMKPAFSRFFALMNIIELAAFIIVAVATLNFFFVEIHAAYGLLVVFLFEYFIRRKTKDAASRLVIFGVLLSAMAAVVHLSKLSVHTWFNYFDLSHLFMAAGAYLFYKGAQQIANAGSKTDN
jgi:hypothetical protein